MSGTDARWLGRSVIGLARHPGLWATAVRQVFVLAPPGWWRTKPFLPLPDADYLRFRLQTAYGDADSAPPTQDLISYLHWCRSWPHR